LPLQSFNIFHFIGWPVNELPSPPHLLLYTFLIFG
jgi:hypothetical protein